MTDLEKKLNELIKTLTTRNQTVQTQKSSGIGGWITAIILSLLSLVGIAVALYYANKRSKELAIAKTALEIQQIETSQKEFEAKKEVGALMREQLLREVEIETKFIAMRDTKLKELEETFKVQKEKIKGLKSWSEINEGTP